MDTYDETSNGTIPNSTSNNFRSNKAFQKSSALQQQQQLNANNINGNSSSIDTIVNDNNKNPIILTSDDFEFPVHECVFKGDVRRLSSLIRTHSISQKDVHGKPPAVTWFLGDLFRCITQWVWSDHVELFLITGCWFLTHSAHLTCPSYFQETPLFTWLWCLDTKVKLTVAQTKFLSWHASVHRIN